MNLLALYLHAAGTGGLLGTILVAALLIWLIFYVIPLPPVVRTIFAVVIALALVLMLLPGCAAYQSSVASRTLSGGYSKDSGTIGVSDTVTYR